MLCGVSVLGISRGTIAKQRRGLRSRGSRFALHVDMGKGREVPNEPCDHPTNRQSDLIHINERKERKEEGKDNPAVCNEEEGEMRIPNLNHETPT